MSYGIDAIADAFRDLGLKPGDSVYVLAALWQMRGFEGRAEDLPAAIHQGLFRVIGETGTLVVSTASMNLCNTAIPFDPATTPSFNVGALSEFVRGLPGARRSFHPFGSYTAIGARAEEIAGRVSRHMFGPETPEARLIDLGAIQVNIGLPANINSTVCHLEQVMGVPYRYTKEFLHPVLRDGEAREEPFYLSVRYRDTDAERNHCLRLFEKIGDRLPVARTALGRGHLCAYSMADFYREATRAFADDIYIWCKEPPKLRPYQR